MQVNWYLPPPIKLWQKETYLAYLPAAHILEFILEVGMLALGTKIGYSDPRTIFSKGAVRKLVDGSLNNKNTGHGNFPPGGMQEFAPSVVVGVPKIYDVLMKGVEDAINKSSLPTRALFAAGFFCRSSALKQGRTAPVSSKVFESARSMLGGRIKLCITGGGPISSDVQNFIRVAFNTNLIQGYGLTETSGVGTVQAHDCCQDGVVGPPTTANEIRLASCVDESGSALVLDRHGKPYLSSDTHHLRAPCQGRGEVLIRGPCNSPGYYIDAGKTAECFQEDGWFRTGDVGVWQPDGTLKIVDRLKNLVKLKGGEYVAIESMEATYAQSVYVNGVTGGLMCYADGDMDRPVALVQVNVPKLKEWAAGAGVAYVDAMDLCKNPAAAAMVAKDLNAIGKGTLGGNEALAAVALLPGTGDPESSGPDAPWTPENTFLTASNKLNRKPIEAGFKDVLAATKAMGIR